MENPTAVPAPAPARRLRRLAIMGGLLMAALLVVLSALVLTAPSTKIGARVAEPRDAKPAQASFLDSPPRRAPETPARALTEARLDALLRNARTPQATPVPAATLPAPPNPASGTGAVTFDHLPPAPSAAADAATEAPPPGVYRPFPSLGRPAGAPASYSRTPSWQAAFASSLTPQNLPPAQVLGQAPPYPPNLLSPPPAFPNPDLGPKSAAAPPETRKAPARSLVSPSPVHSPARVLRAGSILNAILLNAVSSQLEGDVVALLTADVYAVDGGLLLPRGTRLIGAYKNRVALGDSRLAIAWDRLQLEGRTYDLPGLPATSPDGAAGLPGEVNNHTGLVFGRAALVSLIGAAAQLGQPRQSRVSSTLGNQEVLAGSVSTQLTSAATEFLNRAINVTPTVFIPAGSRLTVLTPYDLELAISNH